MNKSYIDSVSLFLSNRIPPKLFFKFKIFPLGERLCKKMFWMPLRVNGGTIPRNHRKVQGKCNQYDFLQLLSKFPWTTFKTIFETL